MASSRSLFAVAFLLLLVLSPVESRRPADTHVSTMDAAVTSAAIDCGAACEGRCQDSSRPNLCKRACGTCCARCSCVPPGTSGNYDTCPCYAAMTTHGGERKCP